LCSQTLSYAVKNQGITQPSKILDESKKDIVDGFRSSIQDGMDISLCSFDSKTNALEYAGANNSLYIIRNDSSKIEEIKSTKMAVGFTEGKEKNLFENNETKLEKGDIFYLLSDGYPDQFGGLKGKKFMIKNLKELLFSIKDQSMSEQCKSLEYEFEEWKGDLEQVDDMSIIGVRV